MKFFPKESKLAVKSKITKIDPQKRMWIFGTVILVFSIFADPKLIPAILVFMVLLTFTSYKTKKRNTLMAKELILKDIEEVEEKLEVVYEHLDSGSATLEDKLILRELEEYMELLEEEMNVCEKTLVQISAVEEKFKNFLAKFKKPSKMITAGEKEKKLKK